MNIILAIALAFLFFMPYKHIDYVEYTTREKIINFSIQIAVLAILIITAICFYKPNTLLLRKLALISNCCFFIGIIFSLIAFVFYQPSILISSVFLIVAQDCILSLPFVINFIMLRKNV